MNEHQTNICTMCHRPETAERFGDFYDAISETGMRLVHFWVCAECAIALGPDQGGVVPDIAGQQE